MRRGLREKVMTLYGIISNMNKISMIVVACVAALLSGCVSGPEGTPPHLVAKIADCDRYVGLNPHFVKAFEFLKRADLATLPPGRYEIDGQNCWANVQEAKLKPIESSKVEAHRRYIDIQAPISGLEQMGCYELDEEHLALPFKPNSDCIVFPAPVRPVTVRPGEFAVFFPPKGGHAPGCIAPGGPDRIRKLVIKVLAE